jgi:hypothetical protein
MSLIANSTPFANFLYHYFKRYVEVIFGQNGLGWLWSLPWSTPDTRHCAREMTKRVSGSGFRS